jgi:hypothetical protein
MKQGFTLAEEKDPVKRMRNLKRSRLQIWEQVIILLDQAEIITHEINIMSVGCKDQKPDMNSKGEMCEGQTTK